MTQIPKLDKAPVRGLFVPPAALCAERVTSLNAYLSDLLSYLPRNDDVIWGHPAVMEFFNLRLEETQLPAKGVDLCWSTWSEHCKLLEDLLREAMETHRIREAIRERRGVDVAHYVRLLSMQVESADRMVSDLETVLLQAEDSSELWQERRIRLDRSIGEISFLRSTLSESARPNSLALLVNIGKPLALGEQQSLLRQQELELEELVDQVHRNKNLAASLQEEVALHNKLLDELGTRIESNRDQAKQITDKTREIR